MNAIFNRRSVRKYIDKPIPEEQITRLLKAAMQAPSAGNQQPWEFVVIRDRSVMTDITKFHPYSKMLINADCAIIVCGNAEYFKFESDIWVQDCAAATENLLLEATDLGIGAVWLGVHPHQERVKNMHKLLNLPESVTPMSAIALGYPDDAPEPRDNFRPERIHRDKW